MNLAELVTVWTFPSVALAILTGVTFGAGVGWISVNPQYSAGIAGPVRIGFLAFLFGTFGGMTFYAGQALGSYLSDDPNWYRVLSRFGLWLVFSASIGVTTAFLVWRDRKRRRLRAHDRVIAERATTYNGRGDH